MGINMRVGKNEIAAMCILLLPVNHSFNFQLFCLTPKVNKAAVNVIKKGEGGHSVHDRQSFGVIFFWQCSLLKRSMILQA